MVGKEKPNEFLELVNNVGLLVKARCGAAVGAGNAGYDKNDRSSSAILLRANWSIKSVTYIC